MARGAFQMPDINSIDRAQCVITSDHSAWLPDLSTERPARRTLLRPPQEVGGINLRSGTVMQERKANSGHSCSSEHASLQYRINVTVEGWFTANSKGIYLG